MAPGKVISSIFFATDELLRVEQLPVCSGSHFIDHGGLQVQEYGTGDVLPSSCLTEECIECIISAAHGFVTGHLPIGLQKTKPTVKYNVEWNQGVVSCLVIRILKEREERNSQAPGAFLEQVRQKGDV